MSKTLLAVDASEHAVYAFEWYVKKFHKPGTKTLLLHCPEFYIQDMTMSPGRVAELQEEVKQNTNNLQQKFKEMAEAAGIDYEWKVEQTTKPGHAIVEVAKNCGVDCIVTGTRGMGKLRRTVMGSVSDYIVHHSSVPVLVCRHPKDHS